MTVWVSATGGGFTASLSWSAATVTRWGAAQFAPAGKVSVPGVTLRPAALVFPVIDTVTAAAGGLPSRTV